jgi:hypothetical protein
MFYFLCHTTIVLTIGAVAFPLAVEAQSQPSIAGGVVISTDGQPVSNAVVIVTRKPALVKAADGRWNVAPGEVPTSSRAATSVTGAFGFSGLPDGTYLLCVDAPGFLKSCDWGGWIEFTMSAGQPSKLPQVRLEKAAVLAITISDPQKLLPQPDRTNNPVAVGLMDEVGAYHPAEQLSVDGSDPKMQLRVPYSQRTRIWIHSARFRLDANGKTVDSTGASIPLSIRPGTVSQPLNVTILGEIAN